MLTAILVICAVILTVFCLYALLKAASNADEIIEHIQEHIRKD